MPAAAIVQQRVWRVLSKVYGPTVQLLGRVSGLLVAVIVVRQVGFNPAAGVFFLAFSLFTVANTVVTSTIEAQSVALLGQKLDGTRAAGLGSCLFGLLAALAMLPVAGVLSLLPGFGGGAFFLQALTLLAGLPLAGLSTCLYAVTLVQKKYLRGALPSALRTVGIIAALSVLLPDGPMLLIPVVLFAGELLRCAHFILLSRSAAIPAQIHSSRTFLVDLLRQAPSGLVSSLNPLLDRVVVASLGLGGLAAFDFAERLYSIPGMLFTAGLLPIVYRDWAGVASREDRAATVVRFARRTSAFGLAFSAAAVLICFVTSMSATSDVRTVTVLLAMYLIGFAPMLTGFVLIRLLVLEREYRWLFRYSLVQLIVNLSFDLALARWLGAPGVALATTARFSVSTALLVRHIHRMRPLLRGAVHGSEVSPQRLVGDGIGSGEGQVVQ